MRIAGPANAVDVTDRTARVVGEVAPRAASVWDVSDRAARSIGQANVLFLQGIGSTAYDANTLVNPAAAANVATTGALSAGTWVVSYGMITTASPANVEFEYVNAAGAVVKTHEIGALGIWVTGTFVLTILVNEQFRVRVTAAITARIAGFVGVFRLS